MIMEFKKSRIVYWTLLVIVGLLLMFLLIPRSTMVNGVKEYSSLIPGGFVIQSSFIRWLLILFGLFLSHVVASAFASSIGNKEFQKIAVLLLEDCNTTAFFNHAQPLHKKGGRQANLVKSLLLGKGFIAEGKFDEAIKISEMGVEESHVDWITNEMRLSLCGVYQNLCISYVEKGDHDKAISTYSKLKAVSEATVKNPNIYGLTSVMTLATRDYVAIFAKKGYKDTKAIEEHCEAASSKYERVIFTFALARMYESFKKGEKALEKYKYVAEMGNTFDCVIKANRYIEGYS